MINVPEYDESGLTLLLYEAGDGSGNMVVRAQHMLDIGATATLITAQGVLQQARVFSLREFAEFFDFTQDQFPGVLDGRLWTVHPNAVLKPMARWARISGFDVPNISHAQDMCELFYRPSIITMDERSSFGPEILRRTFKHLKESSDCKLMYEACRQLITAD